VTDCRTLTHAITLPTCFSSPLAGVRDPPNPCGRPLASAPRIGSISLGRRALGARTGHVECRRYAPSGHSVWSLPLAMIRERPARLLIIVCLSLGRSDRRSGLVVPCHRRMFTVCPASVPSGSTHGGDGAYDT
jgi:hypothetical protein